MDVFEFEAIGTKWHISVDGGKLKTKTKEDIRACITDLDRRLSRFILTSEANAFRSASQGTYTISEELAYLLKIADRLRMYTSGRYDPAIGELFELLGYDAEYHFIPKEAAQSFVLPQWSLEGNQLTIDAGVVFDIGGIGKGYCIDCVARVLSDSGYMHVLVDAGGDLYATEKVSGAAWKAAIEIPGRSGVAAGTVELRNQSLAVSDCFKRSWHAWHHIIDPQKRTPIREIIGVAAIAPSALSADATTSGIFFADQKQHSEISQAFSSTYLVFYPDGSVGASASWDLATLYV